MRPVADSKSFTTALSWLNGHQPTYTVSTSYVPTPSQVCRLADNTINL